MSMFIHRDSVLECHHFSLIYLIVMNGSDNEFVFPTFSTAAWKTKNLDSQASAIWTRRFDEVQNTFESLSARINDKLPSHCQKRGSTQEMAECQSVSGLSQTFRTGWEIRGCDAIFQLEVQNSPVSQGNVSRCGEPGSVI